MKYLFTIALMGCILLIGCNNEDNLPTLFSSIEGEWELAEVRFQWEPDLDDLVLPLDGYKFNPDNTFSRTREFDVEVTQFGKGTYVIEPAHEEDVNALYYVTLNYERGEEMIGNCEGGGYEEGKEYLFISSEKRLRNTWGECDGPTYVYNKK